MSPDGPFNRSAAINDAARKAGDWDVAVVIDADVMLPRGNVLAAVERATATGRVTWAHRRWRGFSQEATDRLTRPDPEWAEGSLGHGGIATPEFSGDIDLLVEKTTALSWSCCIAYRRDAWDTLAGFDERFAGWGFEDGAAAAAAGGLVGWDRIEGDVLNLWHPRTPGAGKADRDTRNKHTQQALVNGRLGMRYMVALRRDHGLTDRPTPSGPEELERDIRNLVTQDERFAADQTPEARATYDGWWPTLEELRDGARRFAIERRAGHVTLIVHTGGLPEAWPERRDYLQRSLASLEEHMTGPIVKRVVYDCWGDAVIREWLEQTYGPKGYYVVGPAERPDFTGSMQQMWAYLAKHAKGEYVFQVEDDFLYERPVDLTEIVATLRDNPQLTQLALLRDACYPDERETGGILGWPLPAFDFREGWFEHRQFFTLNPSVFPRSLTDIPWPSGKHSETLFGKMVLADKTRRSAFWGTGENWITHIGQVRAGSGY